jgi:hypothetical protein
MKLIADKESCGASGIGAEPVILGLHQSSPHGYYWLPARMNTSCSSPAFGRRVLRHMNEQATLIARILCTSGSLPGGRPNGTLLLMKLDWTAAVL